MPCPGCRRIIDARTRLCPHCGIDTDAKLAAPRAIFMAVAAAVLLLLALRSQSTVRPWLIGIAVGFLIACATALVYYKRRR